MTTIDTVCRRLRDVGIFLLGVAAVCMTAHYIYVRTYSPEGRMKRAIEESFAQSFERSLAEHTKK
jgi:hypothetical protein